MEERILTLHPSEGKQGVNIDKARYDRIRGAILEILEDNPEITFTRLLEGVQLRLSEDFNGSISWYVTTVKLDLEARQEIERIPGSKPQRLRLKRTGSGQQHQPMIRVAGRRNIRVASSIMDASLFRSVSTKWR